jgi:Fe-S cluster assembly ATP-binding protein
VPPILEVRNLIVEVNEKKILKGLNLTIQQGEVAALMGPNGSGKSTLSYVLAGHEDYHVCEGDIFLNGKNIKEFSVDERAQEGVFLAFQYPLEIPGVSTLTFLKAILANHAKVHGHEELGPAAFLQKVRSLASELNIAFDMLKRPLNVGFSGGEKKRLEVLQMALLEPTLCILDETDSGLDIDALKIVADGVNRLRSKTRGHLVITHYQRLLNYITPDTVHVMSNGQIVRSGGPELALELENSGYVEYQESSLFTESL